MIKQIKISKKGSLRLAAAWPLTGEAAISPLSAGGDRKPSYANQAGLPSFRSL